MRWIPNFLFISIRFDFKDHNFFYSTKFRRSFSTDMKWLINIKFLDCSCQRLLLLLPKPVQLLCISHKASWLKEK